MSSLIPYVQENGAWSIPDDAMDLIFAEMQSHGLDKIVFYSGGIQTAEDFKLFFKNPHVVSHTIWGNSGIELLAWLTHFGKNYAYAHFCTFPSAWGKRTRNLAKQTLEYWFGWSPGGEPLLDVILGQTPANNRLAVKYIESIGMNTLGTVPLCAVGDKRAGLVLSYITREDFYGTRTSGNRPGGTDSRRSNGRR